MIREMVMVMESKAITRNDDFDYEQSFLVR